MTVPAEWMPRASMQRIIVLWAAGAHKAMPPCATGDDVGGMTGLDADLCWGSPFNVHLCVWFIRICNLCDSYSIGSLLEGTNTKTAKIPDIASMRAMTVYLGKEAERIGVPVVVYLYCLAYAALDEHSRNLAIRAGPDLRVRKH